jgi:outer membrane lipoprotein carrier protein
LTAVLIPAAASEGAPGRDPLSRARALYGGARTVTCAFAQTSAWPGFEEEQHARGRLSLLMPGRIRLAFDEPEGDLLVSDGRQMWTYVEALRQAVHTELDSAGLHVGRLFLSFLEASADVRPAGRETVGGRPAAVYVVDWEGNPLGITELRVWIAPEDGRVTGCEFADAQGSRTRYEFSDIRFDREIPERLFEFEPPPGTDVVSYAGDRNEGGVE